MRSQLALTTAIVLLAPSAWAQSPTSGLGPRTLVPPFVVCADLPVAAPPSPAPVVLGGHNTDGHQDMAPGDLVVLEGTDYTVGQRYIARRVRGGAMSADQRPDGLGAVQTTGWLTVTAKDERTALARVDFACTPIEPGDFVQAYSDLALPSAVIGQGAPDFSDRGTVLFGTDHRESFGDGDIFSIDRGTAQGIGKGARLAIFRDPRNGLPLVYIGDAVVVDPSEHTSKVVLVLAKDAVSAGDVAVKRKGQ